MRIIPEYEPVGKLYLSFVKQFFHKRFKYGITICKIAKAVADRVAVEVFVSEDDAPCLRALLEQNGLRQNDILLNYDSPKRGIIAEYFPIFVEGDSGEGLCLHFRSSNLELSDSLYRFSERVINALELRSIKMDESFGTARIAVNEDLCLVSEDMACGTPGSRRLDFLRKKFPVQDFIPVPSLAGDSTNDLDMYLWPIKPQTWLVSRYPENTPQELSVQPAIHRIKEYGHEVIRIPGLNRIAYDDVNTMPNYANGILINNCALYPSYCQPEDKIMGEILKANGFEAIPIDCRNIILSNSGLHCISKTVPRRILADNNELHRNEAMRSFKRDNSPDELL